LDRPRDRGDPSDEAKEPFDRVEVHDQNPERVWSRGAPLGVDAIGIVESVVARKMLLWWWQQRHHGISRGVRMGAGRDYGRPAPGDSNFNY
jgi:hypothetical protein